MVYNKVFFFKKGTKQKKDVNLNRLYTNLPSWWKCHYIWFGKLNIASLDSELPIFWGRSPYTHTSGPYVNSTECEALL